MTTSPDPEFHLNRPGALIAALPAVLGFVPEQSLVLVTLDGGELGCVMRVDLATTFDTGLEAGLEHLADVAARGAPDAAVAVIVDELGAGCRMCNDDHRFLADVLTETLLGRGIELRDVHVVDRIAAGARWHCADGCGRSGTVEDPFSSPMAAAAVLDGRRLYGRRSELQDVIAIADADRTSTLESAIVGAMASRAGRPRDDATRREDVELAMAAAAAAARGERPTDAVTARLACGLTDPHVRDMLYALAVGSKAAQAETLWSTLSRSLPEPWRADALVLLAFSAYARGDGPLAGISLAAAMDCDPAHRMARMLDEALQRGMRPDQIRELGLSGFRVAARIGVALPPRQPFDRRAG
jgi:alkylhydroperoxidase/carboxymuconolactone decarboxylase family protein YurZ